jgi:group I intron endonuclease
MIHYIYKITNTVNGKVYIGKHSFSKNDNYFGSGVVLKKSIQKYGKEFFDKDILCYCADENELNEKEIFFIKKYDSYGNGYNMTRGGEGKLGFRPSKAQLEKMSLAIKKAFANNPSLAENIRERAKKYTGTKNPFFGKKLSASHIEKMRVARIKAIAGAKNHSARRVCCVETGEIFETATEAVIKLGLKDCGSIIKCCRGQRKTAKGLTWKYC